MSGDEVNDGRWQVPVKLLGGAGELEGRGQRGVLSLLQLLRDDVDTDLIVFEAGLRSAGLRAAADRGQAP
jgi:hypothetical protein